jgi:hypothetical protein
VEEVAAVEVDVLPGHRGDALEDLGGGQVAAKLQFGQRFGQDQGVVVDHRVADQAGALVPDLLFMLGPDPEPAAVRVGDGTAQLVVGLAAVERLLDVAPQHRRVDVVEQVQGADDAVELPQRSPQTVLAPIGAQLPDDHALRCALERQGEQDALDVGLLREDQALADTAVRPDRPVLVAVRRMAEPEQSGLHLALDVAVARGESVPELMQQGEVDMVGAVGVGGVDRRQDIGGVVEQDVEDEVALVLPISE